jgi:hypothetical protein
MITIQTPDGKIKLGDEFIFCQTQNLVLLQKVNINITLFAITGEEFKSLSTLWLVHIPTGFNIGVLHNSDGGILTDFLTKLEDWADWNVLELDENLDKQFKRFLLNQGYLWTHISVQEWSQKLSLYLEGGMKCEDESESKHRV